MFKTLIINLDKDTERMSFMKSQLDSLNISYQRLSAIDPRLQDVSSEYSLQLALEKGFHALLPGELGCAISHKRAYQFFLDSTYDHCLILEDDVELPENFKQIVEREIGRNNNSWEYLLFDYPEVGKPFIRNWIRSLLVNFKKVKGMFNQVAFILYGILKATYILPLGLFEGWRNEYKKRKPGPVSFYRPVYFAGAYLVTRSGAKKLLALTSPVRFTADKLPNQARIKKGLIFRGYSPLVVKQLKRRFGSSLLGLRGDQL